MALPLKTNISNISAYFARRLTPLERHILMAAVDNKHLLDIVAINVDSGVSKKTGNAWTMHKAQCVVSGPDGKTMIGEMILPKSLVETTKPGKYLAEFELGVNYERLVVPLITVLHPFAEPAKAAPVPKAA